MNVTYSFVAIVLLLAANGFFVAAEFALVKARGFRLENMALSGSRSAGLALRIQGDIEPYLAACQLGITMASLGLGWIGEPAVAALLEPAFHWAGFPEELLHTTAFIIGFLLFSSLHIVVGEQVPKTLAIRQAEPVSQWCAYPLRVAYLFVYPLNWLLNRSTAAILSFFNVEEATHAEVLTGDELKGLVATSREYGALRDDKAVMLRNLFEFDERSAGRVMVPRNSVQALDVAANPDDTLTTLRTIDHSRFPVLDSANDDAIVGILLARDIHQALLNGEQEPWKDLRRFCREPMVVPEYQRVSKLFDLMREQQAQMACVVDEYGAFLGIITLEDLLEEIVGEIHDETDDVQRSATITATGDQTWEVDGLASLGDVEREIGLHVPAQLDANTMSGLVMAQLARMPKVGEDLVVEGFRLEVLSLQDRRVGQVRVSRITEPPGDED